MSRVVIHLSEMVSLTSEHWRVLTGSSYRIYGISRPTPIVLPGSITITFSSKVTFCNMKCITILIMFFMPEGLVGLPRGMKGLYGKKMMIREGNIL